MFKLQDTLILAMILLSSGDLLLCFAEIMHLQRLLAAMNLKLLLLPIYHLWGYVTYVALKVALVYSCLRHYLSKKYIHRYAHTHPLFRHALYIFTESNGQTRWCYLSFFACFCTLCSSQWSLCCHVVTYVCLCTWMLLRNYYATFCL